MKKFLILLTLLIAMGSMAVACGTADEAAETVAPDPGGTGAAPDVSAPGGTDADEIAEAPPERPALEQTTFHLGHLNSTAHLLAFVAEGEGFFADEGLDVTLTQFASSGELVAGLSAGHLDAAFMGTIPTIVHQSTGHDITIFGGAMSNGHGVVMKSEFIPDGFQRGDLSVLRGRNIATNINSIQYFELRVLADYAGIEIGEGDDQVNIIYFESMSDAFAALGSPEIDGVTVFSPFASIARNLGHTVVYYCGDFEKFYNQPCCRQVAMTSAINASPNTFTAFSRALIRAYRFSQENREGTIRHVESFIPIDPADIEYEVYGGHADSHPDPDQIATTILLADVVEFGFMGIEYFDIGAFFNIDIYRNALEQLAAENPGDPFYESLIARFESANPLG